MPHTTTQPETLRSETPAALPSPALRVLRLLFELGQSNEHAHVGALASRLGLPPAEVAVWLLRLEAHGLARADRARLTMAGLVVATRLAPVSREAQGEEPNAGRRPVERARSPRSLPPGFVALHPTETGKNAGRPA